MCSFVFWSELLRRNLHIVHRIHFFGSLMLQNYKRKKKYFIWSIIIEFGILSNYLRFHVCILIWTFTAEFAYFIQLTGTYVHCRYNQFSFRELMMTVLQVKLIYLSNHTTSSFAKKSGSSISFGDHCRHRLGKAARCPASRLSYLQRLVARPSCQLAIILRRLINGSMNRFT